MFKGKRAYRFATIRFAIVAIIAISSVTLTVAGTSAAELSFFDSVKEFFGLQTQSANTESPNAAFTPGNLVVYRVGDGSAALSNAATAVFLDEYSTSGTLVQSIAMPTSVSGSNRILTASGTSTSEGFISRSADGLFLVLGGYDKAPGGANPPNDTPATTNRVIGRVSTGGTVDTSTALNDPTGNIRGAASTNGSDLWMTSSSNGIRYATFGAAGASTQLSTTVSNLRVPAIFGGQLYTSTSSGATVRIGTVGSGTPVTSGQTITNLPSFPLTGGPYSFFFADLDAGVAGVDTLYVADDGLGQIQKYSLVGGNWTANGTVALTTARGLAGSVSGSSVTLYVTAGGTSLQTLTDTSGYNATINGTLSSIATPLTNTAFRGVALAPFVAGTPTNTATASPTPTNTFTPTLTATASPSSTSTATMTNTATPTGTATTTATATPTQTPPTGPTFTISQVYGGGGATTGTPTYTHDYIEIKNITNSVQSLNLLKLYYGSDNGNFASTSANAFTLPNVSLNPGQYYLVQVGGAGTVGSPLPVAADATATTMSMAAGSGKVALVTGLLPINTCGSTATPCDATNLSYIVDWVAYGNGGNGPANTGEGGNPAVNNGTPLTNTQGGVRKALGCQDTNNNNLDFDVVTAPVPRNTLTTIDCSAVSPTPTFTPSNTGTPTATATNTGSPTNTATATPVQTPPTGPTFVLSQVYGGGGATTGSPTYANDYIEIKNITNSVQSLNLLKLYYGSAVGNFASSGSNEYFLPNVTLNPGQFYLIQVGPTGSVGAPLPVTPDAITTSINMGADDGKIALVTGLLPENTCGSTATPCDATQLSYIVDWVAYGQAGNGTAGNGEGGTSVNNNASLLNTQGGVRKLNGCQDTNNNNVDFDVVTPPIPRNSSTTLTCGATPTASPTATATSTATATATATATGTPSGSSVAGTVTYGNPASPTTKFISNATVTATGGTVFSTTTAAPGGTAGQYTLTGFGAGNYTVGVSKTTGQNSITSNDAARIAQHVAGSLLIPTSRQRIAADSSNNGTLSSNDAALIARFVSGLGAPIGITNTWRFFVPSVTEPTFPVATSPTTRSYTAPIGTQTGQDYIGILVGETTGNWAAGPLRPAQGPTKSTAISAPQLVTPADNEVIIPVAVSGVANKGVISYEFDLRYDPAVIQPQADVIDLKGTASKGLTAVANPNEPGLLRVVVYGAYPIDTNGVLMNLRFTAVGAPGTISPLTWEKVMFNEGDPGTLATDGRIELSAAAANQAEMTGRVVNAMGQGIANARVTITDTTGATRSVMSNGFGVYRFGGLNVGQTFTITANSRSTTFTPLTISVTGPTVSVDMIAGQ